MTEEEIPLFKKNFPYFNSISPLSNKTFLLRNFSVKLRILARLSKGKSVDKFLLLKINLRI